MITPPKIHNITPLKKPAKHLSFVFPMIFLSACKSDIEPEWESYYTHTQGNESRVEWLSAISIDSYGDVITAGSTIITGSNRQQNILLVKHDSNGQLIWSRDFNLGQGQYRSDDKITDIEIDEEGNAYAIGVRYIVEKEQQRYGSFMLKVDDNGELQWLEELSIFEDARDLELSNDKLYVTGHATQVFTLNGEQLLKINHDKAWDIEVDDAGNFYVVGAYKAEKYNEFGDQAWSINLQANLYQQASLSLKSDGSVIIAHNQDDKNTRISGISADGIMEWSRTYQPATQSYGLPGPALLKTDWRGDTILSLSNDKGRRIVKLDEMGREYWQVSGNAIVQDLAVNEEGSILAVGGGVNEKYDSNGNFIAATKPTPNTQITTGSIALDGANMFVAYSAVNNGNIEHYLAKFIEQ